MTFTERMSSMLNPDVLSAAIKEQQSAEDTGSYGRLKRDQNIWNPDGKISSDQNSHTLGEKTFQRAYSDIKVAKGNVTPIAAGFENDLSVSLEKIGTVPSGSYLKVMVWSDMTNMLPLVSADILS